MEQSTHFERKKLVSEFIADKSCDSIPYIHNNMFTQLLTFSKAAVYEDCTRHAEGVMLLDKRSRMTLLFGTVYSPPTYHHRHPPRILVLNGQHLLVDLLHRHPAAEYGGHCKVPPVPRVAGRHHVHGTEQLLRQLWDGQGAVHLTVTSRQWSET